MPIIFVFVAVLFWLTIVTVVAVGWLFRMMFHLFAGARGLIYNSQSGAHR